MTKKAFDIGHDECNTSNNESFENVLAKRMSRRDAMRVGAGLIGSVFLGPFLSGCREDYITAAPSYPASAALLGFTPVAKSTADVVSVPDTYNVSLLYSLGDPIDPSTPAYANEGEESAESFEHRAGDHHDGMGYFGLNAEGTAKDTGNSARGILCINHENITRIFLHAADEVAAYDVAKRRSAEVDKEVNAHGVSVIEIHNQGSGFAVNRRSAFNRRINAATAMEIYGPARGAEMMRTAYSPSGLSTRGTLNNCSNGYTPWGTYLSCEENWAGYFKRTSERFTPKEMRAHSRYGITSPEGSYGWANATPPSEKYERWHVAITAEDAKGDYRNAANTFGWVVEIDPYSPSSTPRKRTAMGRFAHEGAMPGIVTAGKPIVYYMGDDSKGEYIYKYVSTHRWDPSDAERGVEAGNKYLDEGKLYVAKFNGDGSGTWLELTMSNRAVAAYEPYPFADEADVAIHTRLAADAVGATKMDRPEWSGVHPLTGDVYVTLTNNAHRGGVGKYPPDPANPRFYTDPQGSSGNVNGHIIRIKETDSDPSATTFNWDIYLFGARADSDGAGVNLSGLVEENDFSGPDGLFFSQANKGLMWILTDDDAYTDRTNCMMLCAVPGAHGDGGRRTLTNRTVPIVGGDQRVETYVGKEATTSTLKRFLVGPKGCEITGITETPDGKTLFVNIQHPGEETLASDIATPANYQSHWPSSDGLSRPRSSTLVITKKEGGIVGS